MKLLRVRDGQTDGRQQDFHLNCLLNATECHSSSAVSLSLLFCFLFAGDLVLAPLKVKQARFQSLIFGNI